MGRQFIIIGFLASFALAVWIFFGRDTTSVRENMERASSSAKPRVLLKDFTARRYLEDELSHRMSARSAMMVNPDLLTVSGEVRGWQRRDHDSQQSFSSQQALVYFQARDLASLMERGEVEAVHLSGNVSLGFAQHQLMTAAADYQVATQQVVGSQPVRVEGPERWFTGRDGFKLQLKPVELEMYGPVQGMVKPQERPRRP